MSSVVVIGGGFYGCHIALWEAMQGNKVALIESKPELLTGASYFNQARTHRGYHYPRALDTSAISAKNYDKFNTFYKECIVDDFTHYHAIAKNGSKISYPGYLEFCNKINIPFEEAPTEITGLFKKHTIEGTIKVQEVAFDAVKLKNILIDKLKAAGVEILHIEVFDIENKSDLIVKCRGFNIGADRVVCALYADTNNFLDRIKQPLFDLEFQTTETCFVELPQSLIDVGAPALTLMDGNFFSLMPFPAKFSKQSNIFSMTHVKHGIHNKWHGVGRMVPSDTKFSLFLEDAVGFIPSFKDAKYISSFFTTKAISVNQEDNRPIISRKYMDDKLEVVVGSKLVNIFERWSL